VPGLTSAPARGSVARLSVRRDESGSRHDELEPAEALDATDREVGRALAAYSRHCVGDPELSAVGCSDACCRHAIESGCDVERVSGWTAACEPSAIGDGVGDASGLQAAGLDSPTTGRARPRCREERGHP